MYILYLDDAGSAGNKAEEHFVLAGICLFERQIYYLSKKLNELAEAISPDNWQSLEFHASHMMAGKGFWRSIRDQAERRQYILRVLASSEILRGNWALFGVVVNKHSVSPEDPFEWAFEQLCSRFDAFLRRAYMQGNPQRGIIVLDKSVKEARLQNLTSRFMMEGHRWGYMHSIVDVPFFVDSQATRIIQFADLVAYALWRKFERHDDEFFNVVRDSFDSKGGVVHGLLHRRLEHEICDCPYCGTRGN